MSDFKILSLDGGGSWALIQAMALGEIFGANTPGRDVLSIFNLVAANSGGSLVAGMLAANESPASVAKLFLEEGNREKLFVEKWFAFATRAIGVGPRYKTTGKLEGIRNILDEIGSSFVNSSTRLNALRQGTGQFPDILITAFDYDRQRAVFFRSNIASKASSDPGSQQPPTLAEAMHASSTAPVAYFDEPARFSSIEWAGRRFWDGGTAGLNNPLLAAVMEAIANGTAPDTISAMSIGTGTSTLPFAKGALQPPLAIELNSPGLMTDIAKLAKTILDDPPDAATYVTHSILTGARPASVDSRVVRFNPLIQPIGIPNHPDYPSGLSEEEFATLVALEMDAVAQDEVDLIHRFSELWLQGLIPNQPIQAKDDLTVKIGCSRFGDAFSAAKALRLC